MVYVLILFFCLVSTSSLCAQVTDTTAAQTDSTVLQPSRPDTLTPTASGGTAGQGSLQEGEVQFQATDSLVFNFRNDRIANLYGSAKVTHQSGQLESGTIRLNLNENLVTASTQTPEDTLSQPVLTREGQPPVRSQKIAFNYETEKGRFDVARVTIEQGKITGTKVKNVSPHVIFLEDAIYSTCTLDHPHYYIKMDRAKLVRHENRNEIFFQNARLYILDIPYPIVFPFGYFPGNVAQRQSGILEPTYVFQNTSTRGLGLRNLGWFQYFNDYIVGQASVDIFTSGTFYFDGSTTYRKRDAFDGSIQIGYSRERGLEPTDPDFQVQTQKLLRVQHSQEFSPYSNISADITYRTADFYRRNSYDIDDRVRTTTKSSINYRYRHPSDLYSFSASIRQNRDFQDNSTTLSGPSFNFGFRRLTPFGSDNAGTEESKWYESLTFKYENSFQANYRFDPLDEDTQVNWFEALFNPDEYRQATGDDDHYKYGFRQNADISLNNILASQYLNLSARTDYTEFWFPTTTRRTFNPDSNRVETEQVRGFRAAREFSTNLNFSTTFYGISNVSIGNIEGFRHTVRPNISLSYRPDFSSDFFGYFEEVQTDTSGRTRQFSIFSNEVFRGPSPGERRAINFGISNVFEAKQVKRDSTGETSEDVIRIIDQLNLNSSYNFAADSLKLSNLNTSLTSSVVDGVNLRASANFNFYERDSLGTRIDEFLISDGKLAELVNFNLSASTSFSGGQGRGVQVQATPYFPEQYDPLDQSIFGSMDPYFNTRQVKPIDSPWSFSINFRYNWTLNPNGENRKSATINAQNIQFHLTPEWSFSTRIGYDFIQQELTPSQFSLTRDLHEWTLSFQMNPFGDFQYYFFKLSINSPQLQSIFQKLPLLKNLERSSSPTGRGIGNMRY